MKRRPVACLWAVALIATIGAWGWASAEPARTAQRDSSPAVLPPEAATPPAAPSQSPQTSADPAPDMPFEERVAFFIREFYLSSELKSDEDLERLYAPVVDYFANRRISRERVLADKRAYFAKWPARAYRLVRDTLRVVRRPGDAKIYDVTFRYVFDVASPRRTSRGLGLAELTLDLTSDGGRITRETGRVLERW